MHFTTNLKKIFPPESRIQVGVSADKKIIAIKKGENGLKIGNSPYVSARSFIPYVNSEIADYTYWKTIDNILLFRSDLLVSSHDDIIWTKTKGKWARKYDNYIVVDPELGVSYFNADAKDIFAHDASLRIGCTADRRAIVLTPLDTLSTIEKFVFRKNKRENMAAISSVAIPRALGITKKTTYVFWKNENGILYYLRDRETSAHSDIIWVNPAKYKKRNYDNHLIAIPKQKAIFFFADAKKWFKIGDTFNIEITPDKCSIILYFSSNGEYTMRGRNNNNVLCINSKEIIEMLSIGNESCHYEFSKMDNNKIIYTKITNNAKQQPRINPNYLDWVLGFFWGVGTMKHTNTSQFCLIRYRYDEETLPKIAECLQLPVKMYGDVPAIWVPSHHWFTQRAIALGWSGRMNHDREYPIGVFNELEFIRGYCFTKATIGCHAIKGEKYTRIRIYGSEDILNHINKYISRHTGNKMVKTQITKTETGYTNYIVYASRKTVPEILKIINKAAE